MSYADSPINQIRVTEVYTTPFRIDEVNASLYYIGYLIEGADAPDENEPMWRIKKISQVGSVWKIELADGDSSFDKVWADRSILQYK